MHGGEGDGGDLRFPRVGWWDFVWGPPGWVLWVWWPQFCHLRLLSFRLPRIVLRVLRPGRLPGGCHCGPHELIRDRMRRGIRMWVGGWSRGKLDDTPPSDDVMPPLAQFHLLSRGTGPLSFK